MKRCVRAILLVGVMAISVAFPATGASANQRTISCNGATMWGNSDTMGASTSTLNCPYVRLKVRRSIGGNTWYEGYWYGSGSYIERRRPGTNKAYHGGRAPGIGWRNVITYA